MIRRIFSSKLFVFCMSMIILGFALGYSYTVLSAKNARISSIKIPYLSGNEVQQK